MPNPISSIRNLGPASDAAFARAGISTAEELRGLGADKAYGLLLRAGTKAHFIGYYAMVMGLQGRPWNDCKGAEKAALRVRFNSIVAESNTPSETGTGLPSGIAQELDRMGIRSR